MLYRSKLTLNHTTHFHIYHYSNRSSYSIDALHSLNVVPLVHSFFPIKASVFIHTRTSSSAHAHIPILATPPGPPFVRNYLQFKPTLLPNNRYFLQLLFVVSLKLRIPALLRRFTATPNYNKVKTYPFYTCYLLKTFPSSNAYLTQPTLTLYPPSLLKSRRPTTPTSTYNIFKGNSPLFTKKQFFKTQLYF